ncbi:calcium-binding protein [Agarivorans sp. Toyoura001]|uniref:calcium-binding protein n=1 Tax=Agarivorans sp. Toyoura001 TaxID=2283141 RepID=UPI001386C420|nr:calcium-binding protein [Agarivorans sp. Toyoura001]
MLLDIAGLGLATAALAAATPALAVAFTAVGVGLAVYSLVRPEGGTYFSDLVIDSFESLEGIFSYDPKPVEFIVDTFPKDGTEDNRIRPEGIEFDDANQQCRIYSINGEVMAIDTSRFEVLVGDVNAEGFVSEIRVNGTGADSANSVLMTFDSATGSMIHSYTTYGGDSDNNIYGGNGNDYLVGGEGNDYLSGGDGDDQIFGDQATPTGEGYTNQLDGGAGNDTLVGGNATDIIVGGEGDDLLTGGKGNDSLYGGLGNDTYYYNSGDGNDVIFDGYGANKLVINGQEISELEQTSVGSSIYKDQQGNVYSFSEEGILIVSMSDSEGTLTIENTSEIVNDFGFVLNQFEEEAPIADDSNTYVISDTAPLFDIFDNKRYFQSYVGREQTAEYQFINDKEIIYDAAVAEQISVAGFGILYDTVFEGGNLDDQLTGSDQKNLINGMYGDDYIWGLGGIDLLSGFSGSDHIYGGDGHDFLFANWRTQIYNGTVTLKEELSFYESDLSTENFLYGGSGHDILAGEDGIDTLIGGTGEDLLVGGTGNDLLNGGADNDKIYGDSEIIENTVGGFTPGGVYQSGTNYIVDEVESDAGGVNHDDVIDGGEGDDKIWGEVGNDVITGGDGADRIYGDSNSLDGAYHGDDQIFAGNGNDIVYGGGGNDLIMGGAGDDYINGDESNENFSFTGDDIIYGGLGNDSIQASGGDDTLYGGDGTGLLADGADILEGGAGNDHLFGEQGQDTLRGGAGDDIYYYGVNGGLDIIDNKGGGNDGVLFIDGFTKEDLYLLRIEDDLVILVNGTNDQGVAVKWHFTNDDAAISYIELASGEQIAASEFESIIANGGNIPDGGTTDPDGGATDPDGGATDPDGGTTDPDDGTANLVLGGTGDDQLTGSVGDDIINGSTGNDYLTGGRGSDTYLFSQGDGQDTINNYDWGNERRDLLKFGDGITQEQLAFEKIGEALVITFSGSEDKITVESWFTNRYYELQAFEFSDGSSKSFIELTQNSPLISLGTVGDDVLSGHDGRDIFSGGQGADDITAGEGDDILEGGEGNDRLTGGRGSDTYLFSKGDGQDIINAYDWSTMRHDVLQFGEGISEEQLTFEKTNDNLIISVDGSDDKVTVESWYVNRYYQLQEFIFDGGVSRVIGDFDVAEVEVNSVDSLIDAMASFDSNTMSDVVSSSVGSERLTPVLTATSISL